MNTETLDITESHDRADDIQEPDTPTTDDIVAGLAALNAEIQTAIDGMVHEIDMPGVWTERQKGAYRGTRTVLYQHSAHVGSTRERIQKAAADLKWMLPARDRLRPVQAEIERQIADAPDWQRITDRWEEKRERERQMGLVHSLKMITGTAGVEFFGGRPALAEPLKTLLSEVCPHADCPHRGAPYVFWVGALPALEEHIAEAEQVIAANLGLLERIRAEVTPLLLQAKAAKS